MASDHRAYTSACKVHTDPMYPCKYLKIRSILCCYFWKKYLTILVLFCSYIDRFENFDSPCSGNQPTKEPPYWEIMSKLSSNSDGIQEEVTESSSFKEPKINLKQQLQQVRLQKKLEHNNYQSQQRDKISNDQDIYPPGTCVTIGDSV